MEWSPQPAGEKRGKGGRASVCISVLFSGLRSACTRMLAAASTHLLSIENPPSASASHPLQAAEIGEASGSASLQGERDLGTAWVGGSDRRRRRPASERASGKNDVRAQKHQLPSTASIAADTHAHPPLVPPFQPGNPRPHTIRTHWPHAARRPGRQVVSPHGGTVRTEGEEKKRGGVRGAWAAAAAAAVVAAAAVWQLTGKYLVRQWSFYTNVPLVSLPAPCEQPY